MSKMNLKCRLSMVVLLFTLARSAEYNGFEPKDYCVYGEMCWPSDAVFRQLEADHPTLDVVLRGDAGWDLASNLVLNRRVKQIPGATVYVTTAEDIIAVVNFTQIHNLNLKIISSGHEFIGRNTADGCLQLSVARMVQASTDLDCPENDAGCLTVEPGMWWLQAYRVADSVNRIVLGGAEPSVSVTGWALGGGHSPYSPKIGLGADQILELSMVLADLSLVTLSKDGIVKRHIDGKVTTSEDTDLFWAVRGGGGGTFGVVTSIKYRLHVPPTKFTILHCGMGAFENPKKAMQDIKKTLRPIIANFPDEFGGYLYTQTLCYETEPECQMIAHATYSFTHYGARSENKAVFDELEEKLSSLSQYQEPGSCNATEYNTYYEFIQTQPNVTYTSLDMDGTFLSTSEYTDEFIDEEAEIFETAFNEKKYFSSTWIKLGGETRNVSSGATAINPVFRNAMWTVAYGSEDPALTKAFDDLVDKTVATKAQYYSECDDDLELKDWQNQFWGADTYSELLKVKKKYDPENEFNCKMCVGSLSGAQHTTPSNAETTPSAASFQTSPGMVLGVCIAIFIQRFITRL